MLIRLRVFARSARSQPAALTGLVPSSRQLCLPVTWLCINVCQCVRAETNYSTSPAHVSAVMLGRLQKTLTNGSRKSSDAKCFRWFQQLWAPSRTNCVCPHIRLSLLTHTQEITLAYPSKKKTLFTIFPGNNFRSAISFRHSPGTRKQSFNYHTVCSQRVGDWYQIKFSSCLAKEYLRPRKS